MTGFEVEGDAYDRFVGRYSKPLASLFCDRAGIRMGMRVLDVGCGPGALTAELARRVGVGTLDAVDPSHSFVEACRMRVPGADVRLAGAQDLPYRDASFDAVLAQLVINFIPDAPSGVAEMVRVARPGGVVGAVVWDYADGMTMLRAFWDAAAEVCGDAALQADEGRRMRYCEPESLTALWAASQIVDVEVGPLDVEVEYEGFDDLWWPFTQGVGPAGAFTVALPEDERVHVRELLRRRLGAPDGSFRLSARAWCAVGQKGSSAPA